jgi:pSer/pThr/pTyr-binding forkhead associated (FHA) protein
VLRLLSLDARPKDFLLAVGKNTVGRHPDNDVVIPSTYVSLRHCAVLVSADGGCFIQDLGSRNGVHVEGERIGHPLELRQGDVIRLGDQLLVLLSSPNGTANTEAVD